VFRKLTSETAPQTDVYFHYGLAGDCGNREANSTQKAIQTCQRNSKYNICTGRQECVTKYRPGNDNASALSALTARYALTEARDDPFQPDMIDVGDEGANGETDGHDAAETDEAKHEPSSAQNENETANSLQRKGVEAIGWRVS
jgi:hypothetical protein